MPDSSVSAADTDQGIVWATQQLLEIDRLRDLGQFDSAFALATEVSPLLAKDTLGEDFWDGFSWSANIETDPPGARAYRQAVYAIDDEWEELGYYGLSWGAYVGPIVLAVEDRIDAAVFNAGGLDGLFRSFPESGPITFITHVQDPVLMINGEYDIVYPLETAQKPMFELLGTDPAHKKHVVTPAGHHPPRDVVVRETLEWFDLYLSEQGN